MEFFTTELSVCVQPAEETDKPYLQCMLSRNLWNVVVLHVSFYLDLDLWFMGSCGQPVCVCVCVSGQYFGILFLGY